MEAIRLAGLDERSEAALLPRHALDPGGSSLRARLILGSHFKGRYHQHLAPTLGRRIHQGLDRPRRDVPLRDASLDRLQQPLGTKMDRYLSLRPS